VLGGGNFSHFHAELLLGQTHWHRVATLKRKVGVVFACVIPIATVSEAATETVWDVSEHVAAVFTVPEALAEQVKEVADPFLYKVIATVCAEADAVGATDA
jgi:hypothetical protein